MTHCAGRGRCRRGADASAARWRAAAATWPSARAPTCAPAREPPSPSSGDFCARPSWACASAAGQCHGRGSLVRDGPADARTTQPQTWVRNGKDRIILVGVLQSRRLTSPRFMRSTPYTAWLESAAVASTLAPDASRTRRRTASTACVLSGSATLNLSTGLGPGGVDLDHPSEGLGCRHDAVGSLAADARGTSAQHPLRTVKAPDLPRAQALQINSPYGRQQERSFYSAGCRALPSAAHVATRGASPMTTRYARQENAHHDGRRARRRQPEFA